MNKPISSEAIYKDILKRIINLELEPGSKISENRIACDYDVSRSVVRNSIARLMQNGFLSVYPQRGTYVTLINLEYIRTALLIRISIEKEMLYRFMKKGDKSEVILKMEENIRKQKKFYNANEYMDDFKKLDEEFHKYIILSVQNKNVLELINDHLLHISRWRNVYVRSGYGISRLIDQHSLILECIKRNDLKMALKCMSDHIDTVSDVALSQNNYSHYFINV